MKNRKSNRLQNYDYSQNGMYFITICAKDQQELFGKIKEDKMVLNELGRIASNNLENIDKYFDNVFLDEYVIMPNHIHFLLEINVGVQFIEPENDRMDNIGFDKSNPYIIKNNPMLSDKMTLGKIIRYFKAKSSYEIRKTNNHFQWQRSFYDHIIRNDESLKKIREYIQINPRMWEKDKSNIENIWM